jgi:hypothetical protein
MDKCRRHKREKVLNSKWEIIFINLKGFMSFPRRIEKEGK